MKKNTFYPRYLTPYIVDDLLSINELLTLVGSRQVGKTTLVNDYGRGKRTHFYAGDKSYEFDDRMFVLPMTSLWEA